MESHNWGRPGANLREVVGLKVSGLNPGQWFHVNQWPLLRLHLPGYDD